MFVWSLYLYTVKRAELCTSHTVLNINSIHLKLIIKKKKLTTADPNAYSCLENSCFFSTLPSWGYIGGKEDVNSLSATDCFNTVGSFQHRDVCNEDGTYHSGKPALFEGSQNLHNSLKFSSPLQDLLDWGAGLLGITLFPMAWSVSFSLASVWGNQAWKRYHLCWVWPLSVLSVEHLPYFKAAEKSVRVERREAGWKEVMRWCSSVCVSSSGLILL